MARNERGLKRNKIEQDFRVSARVRAAKRRICEAKSLGLRLTKRVITLQVISELSFIQRIEMNFIVVN